MNLLDWIYPRRCVGCNREGRYICRECSKSIVRQGGSLQYRGVVRKILKEIKYRGSYDMVTEVVELWNPICPNQNSVVAAVPMWEGKKRLRGFNQAELIARELAKRWEMPYVELLRRSRATAPMYGLKRWERVENIDGAFEINPKSQIRKFSNVNIVLVDDVWTSGATMRACELVLRKAGFVTIELLALAR